STTPPLRGTPPLEGNLEFLITGNGFLYNMVRIIVGTLVYVGMRKLDTNIISEMIASKNRKLGGPTAPACGLVLWDVEY
ncbi:MAG: tRNA pseudouridine(38-40) synthase TruA, partial [Clostridia bacterium]|nr:tRNA pseudouridine(38-40) synthase TruA [Clostridia bacterium]